MKTQKTQVTHQMVCRSGEVIERMAKAMIEPDMVDFLLQFEMAQNLMQAINKEAGESLVEQIEQAQALPPHAMGKVTALELDVLHGIVKSEYQRDSAEALLAGPFEDVDSVWSFSVTHEEKSRAGALGSLAKKGLVCCYKHPGEDECVDLTRPGFDLLVSCFGKGV